MEKTFTITDKQTGRTMKVSPKVPGGPPPSEEEAREIFDRTKQEIVAGTPSQTRAQSARNLQQSLGLSDPISLTETVPFSDRVKAGFAPTQEEHKAFYTMEYGDGNFIPVSDSMALVRVPDGKGGKHWVPDNPYGLDSGDIAGLASMAPQMITGAAAAAVRVPNQLGAAGRVAVASGAAATASGAIGAIQDVIYRYATNTPIDLKEIGERRGVQAGTDFVIGNVLPFVSGAVSKRLLESKQAKEFIKPFIEQGDQAVLRLKEKGFNPTSASQLVDQIRDSTPYNLSSAQAGDAIANIVSQADKKLLSQSAQMLGRAAQDLEGRAQKQLTMIAAPAVSPVVTGQAAIGGIKKIFGDAKVATDTLFTDAMNEIGAAAKEKGIGKAFISLNKTSSAINDLKGSLLKGAEGETSDLYLPLLSQIKSLSGVAGTPQELMAVRQLRTMLGEKIGGSSDMFPGIGTGVAKKLYKSLSEDIDDSIAKFSGPGAKKLNLYNQAYKSLVQPLETSSFLGKAVNDGFENPEQLIRHLSAGGSEEWAMAKQFIPPNTYASVRRAVMDDIMGGAKVSVGGKDVMDLGKLTLKMREMTPEVKNEIFGTPDVWKSLEKMADELGFMKGSEKLFTTHAMPSLDMINDAITAAKTGGYNQANASLKSALDLAAKRREGIASTLIAQIKNGTVEHVAAYPELFFDAVVLSGKQSPQAINSVLGMLPRKTREDIADTAFQSIWDRVKDVTQSAVKGKSAKYDSTEMLKIVFGSKSQRESIEMVLGKDRFGLIEDWTSYMMKLEIENSKRKGWERTIAGLASVIPYHGIFASRLASLAMRTSAGASFIHGATPEAATLFAESRKIMNYPRKTAVQIAIMQRAMNSGGYGDYMDMMHDLSPEQQDALDDFITIKK